MFCIDCYSLHHAGGLEEPVASIELSPFPGECSCLLQNIIFNLPFTQPALGKLGCWFGDEVSAEVSS